MNNIFRTIQNRFDRLFKKLRSISVESFLEDSLIAPKREAPRAPQKTSPWKQKIETAVDTYYAYSTPRLSIREQAFFAKRLSFLVKADVPLLEGLFMLQEQSRSHRFTRILKVITHDVSNGQFLSKSLLKFSRIFGEFAINIIKVGETSGNLSQNLEYLADELKKRSALRRKVVSAFIYPAVITLATIGITIFLIVYLFPKIMPIFASLHAELPMSTRIVMWVSELVREHGFTMLAILTIVSAALTVAVKKSSVVHFIFDLFILKIPLVGGIIRDYNVSNITRTLGILLKSGITLNQAVAITSETTKNLVYKRKLLMLGSAVVRGEKMSTHLRKYRAIFPEIFGQMVAVGERSGSLSNTFVYISDLYENEVDDLTKNLSTMIEPALMIVMGILVGFIAISIITPIYGITQNLHG